MKVQRIMKDKKENTYFNSYLNEDAKAIVCFDNNNHLFKGNPKISIRRGPSKFGNEMIIQFLIKGKEKQYTPSSEHEVIEIYFKEEDGIDFLKQTLKFFEDNKTQ